MRIYEFVQPRTRNPDRKFYHSAFRIPRSRYFSEKDMTQFPERFNMAEYFLDRNLAAGRGDKVCLRFGDERWTYAEVVKHSNRAGRLLRELGAGVEDRVLIALPDCPQFVACWFGAAKIGSVIAMVNPLLPAEDYDYYLDS